jgi:hypothetical protein
MVFFLANDKAATTIMDPRLYSQYAETKELVGIDEIIDELVKILMGDNGVPFAARQDSFHCRIWGARKDNSC